MPTKEFTLRNKSGANPIQTLSTRVLEAFLAARPESATLVLAKYRNDYKSLTGKTVVLVDDQKQALLSHFSANVQGLWSSQYSGLNEHLTDVMDCFQKGFLDRTLSAGMLSDLNIAETFFSMLDETLKIAPTLATRSKTTT